ncbi:MAG: helix-turn-helix transcriptional regulator, partial [Pseudomonadota bacterium]
MDNAASIPEIRGFDSFEIRLGDELRGERATLGKSLLDVQRDLRIKAAYIAAIENCDTDVFPNKGFVAGYVRSYARYLGLEPEDVFERFSAESGFSGVNAELSPKKKAGGQIIHSGPVKVDKQDPLFSP